VGIFVGRTDINAAHSLLLDHSVAQPVAQLFSLTFRPMTEPLNDEEERANRKNRSKIPCRMQTNWHLLLRKRAGTLADKVKISKAGENAG
jgi:hypothetical protein